MALLHRATLHPTKLELLTTWLPSRSWYAGQAGEALQVATYRFDDPADAVGIETLLVRVGDGPVYQTPLTYRAAPLAGADDWLLGTAEHSVLGRRWVYDGAADPVYAAALASAILGNTGQAEQLVDIGGRLERREFSMTIVGSGGAAVPVVSAVDRVVDGDPTLIVTDTVELTVIHRLDAGIELDGAVLTGAWPGQATATPLASATLR
jgi:hypothetical protein